MSRKNYDNILTKEVLYEEFIVKQKSIKNIAKDLGVDDKTIKKYIQKHNLPQRRDVRFKDITGQIFSRLTVTGYIKHKNHASQWICKCECGNETIVSYWALRREQTKSCGCYAKECTSKRNYQGGKYISLEEFNRVKKEAIRRNIKFDISIEDIESLYEQQNKKCIYTDIDVVFNITKFKGNGKKIYGNASIDRIDSTKDYTIDNIQIIHKDINFMKYNFSEKQFFEYIKQIFNHCKEKIESKN